MTPKTLRAYHRAYQKTPKRQKYLKEYHKTEQFREYQRLYKKALRARRIKT